MSRKSERTVGVLRCGTVLLAGLLAVSLLSACADGGAKQGSNAAAVSRSSSSPAVATSAASSSASESAGATTTGEKGAISATPTSTKPTATTAPAEPKAGVSTTPAEPKAEASTDADAGTVTEHMDANEMPPKPAPPARLLLPSVAYTQTEAGAKVAAIWFFNELEYLQATGDDGYFQWASALDVCDLCLELRDGAVSLHENGGYTTIGVSEVSNLRILDSRPEAVKIQVDFKWPGATAYFPADRIVEKYKEYIGPATIEVKWIEDQWVVVDLALLGS